MGSDRSPDDSFETDPEGSKYSHQVEDLDRAERERRKHKRTNNKRKEIDIDIDLKTNDPPNPENQFLSGFFTRPHDEIISILSMICVLVVLCIVLVTVLVSGIFIWKINEIADVLNLYIL